MTVLLEGQGYYTCLTHIRLLWPRAAGVCADTLCRAVRMDPATHLNAPFLLVCLFALPGAVAISCTVREGRMQDFCAKQRARAMQLAEVAKDNDGIHGSALKIETANGTSESLYGPVFALLDGKPMGHSLFTRLLLSANRDHSSVKEPILGTQEVPGSIPRISRSKVLKWKMK